MTNNHHEIKVTDGSKTLVLTFNTYKAAMEAYFEIPNDLQKTYPRQQLHKLYNAKEAKKAALDVMQFFSYVYPDFEDEVA